MNQHEGITCNSCNQSNFTGKRFRCLICFDYSSCQNCYESNVVSGDHSTDHPTQCLLTRSGVELYFGGEPVTDRLQSYTCPLCDTLGFNQVDLFAHVSSQHLGVIRKVLCPVCVCSEKNGPVFFTDNLSRHFTVQHSLSGPIEILSVDGHSPQRSTFGQTPRPNRGGIYFGPSNSLPSFPSMDGDPMDRLSELFSQLSDNPPRTTFESTLQQFQMQVPYERSRRVTMRPPMPGLATQQELSASSSTSSSPALDVLHSRSGESRESRESRGAPRTCGGSRPVAIRLPQWNEHAERFGLLHGASSSDRSTHRSGSSGHSRSLANVTRTPALQHQHSNQNKNHPPVSALPTNQFDLPSNSLPELSEPTKAFSDPRFFLSKFLKPQHSEEEKRTIEKDRADRSHFVQALVLSTFAGFEPGSDWVNTSTYSRANPSETEAPIITTRDQAQQTLPDDVINEPPDEQNVTQSRDDESTGEQWV